jgi:tRNA U34 2-thiouridine synthase MnmA/TrmU
MAELELPPLNRRAVVLFSGGLDSQLASLLLREQGIDALAINFQSPFYQGPLGTTQGTRNRAVRAAERLGIPYRVMAMGLPFLELLRAPEFGFGKNINPCVDCKIHMMRRVRELMIEDDRSFLVTGEVLGQRPMSQRKDTFPRMEKAAGLVGRILRPLSARALPPTLPEEAGIVDRARLLAITGRSRRMQAAEMEKRGVTDYPGSAGGCLLTDPLYAPKLRHLLALKERIDYTDILLLRIGRHFRLGPGAKVVVTRNEAEGKLLGDLTRAGTWYFRPLNFKGPDALVVGLAELRERETVAAIVARYGKNAEGGVFVVNASHGGAEERHDVPVPFPDEELAAMRI